MLFSGLDWTTVRFEEGVLRGSHVPLNAAAASIRCAWFGAGGCASVDSGLFDEAHRCTVCYRCCCFPLLQSRGLGCGRWRQRGRRSGRAGNPHWPKAACSGHGARRGGGQRVSAARGAAGKRGGGPECGPAAELPRARVSRYPGNSGYHAALLSFQLISFLPGSTRVVLPTIFFTRPHSLLASARVCDVPGGLPQRRRPDAARAGARPRCRTAVSPPHVYLSTAVGAGVLCADEPCRGAQRPRRRPEQGG